MAPDAVAVCGPASAAPRVSSRDAWSSSFSGTRPAWTTTMRGPRSKLRRHHLADVLDARLLVLGHVEAAAQRAAQGVSSRLWPRSRWQNSRRPVCDRLRRRQVAGRVDLHAGDAEAAGLGQGLAQRQAERFQADADLEIGSWLERALLRRRAGMDSWVKWCNGRTSSRKIGARQRTPCPSAGCGRACAGGSRPPPRARSR